MTITILTPEEFYAKERERQAYGEPAWFNFWQTEPTDEDYYEDEDDIIKTEEFEDDIC
jgi:hypothetical protein